MSLHGLWYCFIGIIAIYILIPSIIKIVLRRKFLSKMARTSCMCLTFDDGPNPASTRRILHLLRQYKAKATFFVLGENIDRYPEIIKLILDEGHEIGHHSYSHYHAFKSGPFLSLSDMIRWDRAVTRHKLNLQYNFYRPPFGKLNFVTLLYVLCMRKKMAFWNIDPKDFKTNPEDHIERMVLPNLKPGSVVLLHDGRVNGGSDPARTIDALEQILRAAAESNLCIATISQAFCVNHEPITLKFNLVNRQHNSNETIQKS